MKIIYSEKCLEYDPSKLLGGHPEVPERVSKTYDFLKQKGFEFIEASPCSEKEILLAHSENHLNIVKSANFSGHDTVAFPDSLRYARLSAGAAIQAAELACKDKEFIFSLTRPPGHHASIRPAGFCYLNSMAIAISKLLKGRVTRAAILDIDVHHGNGTEDLIYGKDNVLFISIHQYPLYPLSGLESRLNCINIPLNPGTTEEQYLAALNKALFHIERFGPEILGISAGFDTYCEEDKYDLGDFQLKKESYRKIGEMISRTCKQLKIPSFAILEGGYSEDLPELIHNFLNGIKDGESS
ncbi:histone deacetylase [Candidatus Pacearchaeota archaeon]|nr:histone deacetylase [Candidatus Pacearchaeota archaeon]